MVSFRSLRFFCILIALSSVLPAEASTVTTLTFDGVTVDRDPYEMTEIESGYVIRSLADFGGDQNLHFDIALGPFSYIYEISRVDLSNFRFQSLDVSPIGTFSQFPGNPQVDLMILGFLDGVQIASAAGTSQNGGETVSGDSSFGQIDLVRLVGVMTQNVIDKFVYQQADVHLSVDNVVLSSGITPVPLPSGIAFLVSGLGLLWSCSRRSKCRHATTTARLSDISAA